MPQRGVDCVPPFAVTTATTPGRDVRIGMDAQFAAPVFRLRVLDVGKRRMGDLVAQPAGGADLRAADGDSVSVSVCGEDK